MERRLKFEMDKLSDPNTYFIYNSKEQWIGKIKKIRVGSYLHWCLAVEEEMMSQGEMIYWSAGCLDEIREFIKNPQKYKEKFPNYVIENEN